MIQHTDIIRQAMLGTYLESDNYHSVTSTICQPEAPPIPPLPPALNNVRTSSRHENHKTLFLSYYISYYILTLILYSNYYAYYRYIVTIILDNYVSYMVPLCYILNIVTKGNTMKGRLDTEERLDIIRLYEEFTPVIEIADKYGVSREAIYKTLKRAGVNTSKGSFNNIPVTCHVCGAEFTRCRAYIRKTKHMHCSEECYMAWLKASPYREWRQGGRIGREVVGQHFDLEDGHIVHHENGNQTDNRPENLKVFANQGDHVRHHRGFEVTPLWEGN